MTQKQLFTVVFIACILLIIIGGCSSCHNRSTVYVHDSGPPVYVNHAPVYYDTTPVVTVPIVVPGDPVRIDHYYHDDSPRSSSTYAAPPAPAPARGGFGGTSTPVPQNQKGFGGGPFESSKGLDNSVAPTPKVVTNAPTLQSRVSSFFQSSPPAPAPSANRGGFGATSTPVPATTSSFGGSGSFSKSTSSSAPAPKPSTSSSFSRPSTTTTSPSSSRSFGGGSSFSSSKKSGF